MTPDQRRALIEALARALAAAYRRGRIPSPDDQSLDHSQPQPTHTGATP